ncbi:MAG: hypothetical protein Q8O88_01505 [bacterium]|nr:hypothetical protein [bacterium]
MEPKRYIVKENSHAIEALAYHVWNKHELASDNTFCGRRIDSVANGQDISSFIIYRKLITKSVRYSSQYCNECYRAACEILKELKLADDVYNEWKKIMGID